MCTRALYQGSDNLVITGRTMDWAEDMHSNAWVFPRGMVRDGAAKSNSGKIQQSQMDLEVRQRRRLGLRGWHRRRHERERPRRQSPLSRRIRLRHTQTRQARHLPPTWAQYVLDNFASVQDTVEALRTAPFNVVTGELPNGKGAQLHLSISDESGDSAIFEYIGGKLVIHHSPDYVVLTNTPTYDKQLAIGEYWQNINPLAFLPGSVNAADRFVRASFLINAIPKQMDPRTITAVPGRLYYHQALAAVLSVMRAVSVPLGIADPDRPNLASTLWRTVHDHKDKVFLFDSATSPNTFWVPFADLDFSTNAPVRKLTIAGGNIFAGNAAGKFETAGPFAFLAA